LIHGRPRRWRAWLLVWVAGAAAGAFVAPTLAAFSSVTSNPGNSFEAAVTFPTPQWVKEIGSSACGGTSSVITVPTGGVAAGNTVIVRLVIRSPDAGAVSASDSKSNTYTKDVEFLASNGVLVVVFSASVGTALAPGDTITVSHPAGESEGAAASEFSGVASVSRVDATGTAEGESTTPSATVTTVQERDLLVGVVGSRNHQTYTEAANWTMLSHQAMACGGAPGNAVNHSAWRGASSPGPYSYAPTVSATARWAAVVVAYKRA
jgi:hypothetical protein